MVGTRINLMKFLRFCHFLESSWDLDIQLSQYVSSIMSTTKYSYSTKIDTNVWVSSRVATLKKMHSKKNTAQKYWMDCSKNTEPNVQSTRYPSFFILHNHRIKETRESFLPLTPFLLLNNDYIKLKNIYTSSTFCWLRILLSIWIIMKVVKRVATPQSSTN